LAQSRENSRRQREKWPEKVYAASNRARRFLETNWTGERFDLFLKKQQGLCAICGRKMKRPAADHDHETFQPRELLCHGCNIGLGHVEKPGWLEAALLYIERWKLVAQQFPPIKPGRKLTMCPVCGVSKGSSIRGMCRGCYQRQYAIDHPEIYKRARAKFYARAIESRGRSSKP
jgi:hypothetical protein